MVVLSEALLKAKTKEESLELIKSEPVLQCPAASWAVCMFHAPCCFIPADTVPLLRVLCMQCA